MSNYCVIPCELCKKPLRFEELQDAILWTWATARDSWWSLWFEDNDLPDFVYAHLRCWGKLSKVGRWKIRGRASTHHQPISVRELT